MEKLLSQQQYSKNVVVEEELEYEELEDDELEEYELLEELDDDELEEEEFYEEELEEGEKNTRNQICLVKNYQIFMKMILQSTIQLNPLSVKKDYK